MDREIHPAPSEFTKAQIEQDPILHFFHHAHLPPKLQATSRWFADLAWNIVINLPRNAERTVALRKLLEAKDAAVRANLPAPGKETQCAHNQIYADDGSPDFGTCTQCHERVSRAGYAQSSGRAEGFLIKLPELGEPQEVGGHDEDRDGPVPFSG